MAILDVSNLHLQDRYTGKAIVSDSSFRLDKGSCLAIVGESGSGKSATCKAIMGLHQGGIRQSGRVMLQGRSLAELSDKEWRKVRGKQLYMVMQNGMRAFDPSCPIGVHIRETLTWHLGWSREEITGRMKRAMESVMLRNPIETMNKYPHQLSGGMLQRVMIALALVLEPDIVIADEPTTALDTITQFEVIEQLIQLRSRTECSMIFVSHDLGIVRKIADHVIVMRDGEIVEQAAARAVFNRAQHEYTRSLLAARQAVSQHFISIMEE